MPDNEQLPLLIMTNSFSMRESKTRGEKVFTVAKIIIYFVLFHGSDRI